MTNSDKMRALTWQCRRGMLELDVILMPFLEQYFSSLNDDNQLAFSQLLEQADPDIYTWVMGFGQCKQENLKEVIGIIREKMAIA
jgi:antitoxin CptB